MSPPPSRSLTTVPGIPEDVQQRIFEPFFTTKDYGKGTGLGLDIVNKIVAKHHGEIGSQLGDQAARSLLSSCRLCRYSKLPPTFGNTPLTLKLAWQNPRFFV